MCCAALLLSGCAGLSAMLAPAAPPGSTAPAVAITPLGGTVVDEQVIDTSYNALHVAVTCSAALRATKVITPGSDKALAVAKALDDWRNWLNLANSARKAGNATSASAAFAQVAQIQADLTRALTGSSGVGN